MEDSLEKFVTGPLGGDVIQFPVRLTLKRVEELFGSKDDDDGMPRFRFPDGTHSACAWSDLLPMVREWLEAGAIVIYYSIETRFDFEHIE